MQIPLIEPTSTRYIHVNPVSNRLHLLVPFVGGEDISTDNTCQSREELKVFFQDGCCARELEAYKSVLKLHLALLEEGDERRNIKKERMTQINIYLQALTSMSDSYDDSVDAVLSKPSNLYSIQLRPQYQDGASRVVNPIFTINRCNDFLGTPLSPLYNKMHAVFPTITLGRSDPHQTLVKAVLDALSDDERNTRPVSPDLFTRIQEMLAKQYIALLPVDIGRTVQIDFFKSIVTHGFRKETINKAYIDFIMGYLDNEEPKAYIAALLRLCVPHLATTQEISPFYQVHNESRDKAESLSITTQFYLGILNVHCRARGISNKNFGQILDNNAALSQDIVDTISSALRNGDDVEQAIVSFINEHKAATEFNLSDDLNATDKETIQAKFERTYRTVTATQENPHMDDFMILDTEDRSEHAIFFTKKGLICTDFANIALTTELHQAYFTTIFEEAQTHPEVISPKDEPIITVDIEPEALVSKLSEVSSWDQIPKEVADVYHALPNLQPHWFLCNVAKGQQDEASAILQASDDAQALLTTPAQFTDYSGRTFNCTAYEYAYWAKDTHMRRMLENHMDNATKVHLLERVNQMEREGLAYQQHGVSYQNPHYDVSFVLKALTPDEFRRLQTMVGDRIIKINHATTNNYATLAFTATEYEELKQALALQASVWNWML